GFFAWRRGGGGGLRSGGGGGGLDGGKWGGGGGGGGGGVWGGGGGSARVWGEVKEGGVNVGERPEGGNEGGGGAEAQDGDGIEGVLADGEVLQVAVVARHDQRLAVAKALDQVVEEFIEDFQHLARGLEITSMADLIGGEVPGDGQVAASRDLQKDLGRFARGAQENVAAGLPRTARGDVVV